MEEKTLLIKSMQKLIKLLQNYIVMSSSIGRIKKKYLPHSVAVILKRLLRILTMIVNVDVFLFRSKKNLDDPPHTSTL